MIFGCWQVLLGLFVPAMLLSWIWLRDRFPKLGLGSDRRVVLPQDYVVERSPRLADFVIRLLMSAAPLMLGMAIILCAGPRQLDVPQAKRKLTNIEFCLDLSGSMVANFGNVSRYEAAMAAMNGFIEQRSGDAFGLTVFGDAAHHWIPLTTDPSAFRCSADFLDPRDLPPGYGGGTMIGLGLEKCQEVLITREKGDRMIILISDGESWDLNDGNEERIAKSLLVDEIVVYSIHIGGGITPAAVSTITNITNGASFSPEDEDALDEVFLRIDKMEVAELERTYAEILDWFPPFAIGGLACAVLSLICLWGLRYTPW